LTIDDCASHHTLPGSQQNGEGPVNREFLVDHRHDAIHVLLTGEIDVAAVPAVTRSIQRALANHGRRIVINLDAVTFLDSSGLGAIVGGYRDAVRLGVGFSIGPPAVPAVARVLELTGLGDALAVDEVSNGEAGSAG
jgi:anti-sigma B factor antagonist